MAHLKEVFRLRQVSLSMFIAVSCACTQVSQKILFGQLNQLGSEYSEILKKEIEQEVKAEAERVERERRAEQARRDALL